MTRPEHVKKNIALTFDFIGHLLNHQEILEHIPDGAEVEFVEFDLPMTSGEDTGDEANKAIFFKVKHPFSKIRGV